MLFKKKERSHTFNHEDITAIMEDCYNGQTNIEQFIEACPDPEKDYTITEMLQSGKPCMAVILHEYLWYFQFKKLGMLIVEILNADVDAHIVPALDIRLLSVESHINRVRKGSMSNMLMGVENTHLVMVLVEREPKLLTSALFMSLVFGGNATASEIVTAIQINCRWVNKKIFKTLFEMEDFDIIQYTRLKESDIALKWGRLKAMYKFVPDEWIGLNNDDEEDGEENEQA